MKKIALIGDIVSSKKIKNRSEVQKRLLRLFEKINSGNKNLTSPFTITLGDEFQALYNRPVNLFQNIWQILLVLHPEKARFSIGVGELTTRINTKQSIGMDGPAFHNARQGLMELKKSYSLFTIIDEGKTNFHLAKQSLFLISHVAYKWSSTRLKILNMLYEGKSVKEISGKLGITDKAVYKNIDAGALDIVIEITDGVTAMLNDLLRKK
ncbi:MAG: SatD family protein [Bacteroidetes bacterium]|nr:SatD family protein [Bacteroidota bacterium]